MSITYHLTSLPARPYSIHIHIRIYVCCHAQNKFEKKYGLNFLDLALLFTYPVSTFAIRWHPNRVIMTFIYIKLTKLAMFDTKYDQVPSTDILPVVTKLPPLLSQPGYGPLNWPALGKDWKCKHWKNQDARRRWEACMTVYVSRWGLGKDQVMPNWCQDVPNTLAFPSL